MNILRSLRIVVAMILMAGISTAHAVDPVPANEEAPFFDFSKIKDLVKQGSYKEALLSKEGGMAVTGAVATAGMLFSSAILLKKWLKPRTDKNGKPLSEEQARKERISSIDRIKNRILNFLGWINLKAQQAPKNLDDIQDRIIAQPLEAAKERAKNIDKDIRTQPRSWSAGSAPAQASQPVVKSAPQPAPAPVVPVVKAPAPAPKKAPVVTQVRRSGCSGGRCKRR